MNFASDNWAGAHPRIVEALSAHAGGFAPAYGTSDLDRQLERAFGELFEREVAVFFVGTGTAANALGLSLFGRPGGVAFCHREAHAMEDEGGAPEFLTGGARLHGVDGAEGRLEAAALEAAIRRFPPEFVHAGQPMAASLTQATEIGTTYALDDVAAIAEVCRAHDIALHMDGARFANALVALEATPADMTWKQGVDVLSFGGTKNGCWCAEALVVFDPGRAREMPYLRKRAAHLFSKSRFIAAQFLAYLEDGLWLETARHANAMARRLADHFGRSAHTRLAWQPQTNEVFPVMPARLVEQLRDKGAVFYPWHAPHGFEQPPGDTETMARFVTSFATTSEEVDALGDLIA